MGMLGGLVAILWAGLWPLLLARQCICIYNDEGVCHFSTDILKTSLAEMFATRGVTVKMLMAADIDADSWARECQVLVVPGGRDVFYEEALTDRAIANIQKFVEAGGSYFGICAGAYFASSKVVFEPQDKAHAVVQDRRLSLFPAPAFGPKIPEFTYSPENMHAAQLDLFDQPGNVRTGRFLLMGGCYFTPKDVKDHGWRGLAQYSDTKDWAVIEGGIGSGKVILSCPHIDYDPTGSGAWIYTNWNDELSTLKNRRYKFFKGVLERLLKGTEQR